MGDIRVPVHKLKQLDFPQCAQECLRLLEWYVVQPNVEAYLSRSHRHFREIQAAIDEYLLCISQPAPGGPKVNYPLQSALQELQILREVILFFDVKSKPQNMDAKKRYLLLELIFGDRSSDGVAFEARMKILAKLITLIVHFNCASPLLSDIAQLLQKPFKLYHIKNIIELLVQEFCVDCAAGSRYLHENQLLVLANSVELFGATLFAFSLEPYVFYPFVEAAPLPPLHLIELLTAWISSNSKLLPRLLNVSPRDTKYPATGSLSVTASKCAISTMLKLIFLTCTAPLNSTAYPAEKFNELFTNLQTALLQVILAFPKTAAESDATVVLLRSSDVVEVLHGIEHLLTRNFLDVQLTNDLLERCLDRLSQVLQVSISQNCFRGSKKEVESAFNFDHKLFSFILSTL